MTRVKLKWICRNKRGKKTSVSTVKKKSWSKEVTPGSCVKRDQKGVNMPSKQS